MRLSYLKKLSFLLLLSFLWNSTLSIAGITANGNQGTATTAYTNATANVPIYVWCTSPSSLTPASLTATPTTAGTYTFQWYKHNAATFQWASYATTSGTSSTISNLTNGGYKVEVKNGTTTVECFHVWVWNFAAATTLGKTGACSNVSLTNTITADTFVYYNPPAPPSLINSTTQISVCFSATHTYVSDLGFYLVGPASCGSPIVTLAPNPGANCNSGNDVSNLCFSNASTNTFNVCTASTPLTGTYGKYGALGTNISWSSLNGCDASAGGWKVQIFDCVGLDFGALTNASITFSNLTSVCGSPTSITHSSGPINSAINDNSCNTTTASTFNVPSPFSLPIKLGALRAFQWSSNSGNASFTTPIARNTTATVPSGLDSLSVTTTFTIGTATCTKQAKIAHNNPTPIASSIVLKDTICSSDTAKIQLSSNFTTTNFTWTAFSFGVTGASNGTGNSINQILNTTSTNSGYVVYTITPSNSGCVGAAIIDTIVVHPKPIISSSPIQQTLCGGDTTSFNLTSNVVGTNFTWMATSSGIIGASSGTGNTIAQVLSTIGTTSGQAIYTITASANGCASNSLSDTAIVHPNPIISSSPIRQTLCSGDTASFILNSNVLGTNFTWMATSTGINGASSGTGNTIAQVLSTVGATSGQAIYTITASANGCASNSLSDTAIVHPNPIISSSPIRQTLCSGDTTSFILTSNVAGTNFTWMATSSGINGASSGTGNTIAQVLSTVGTTSGQAIYTITASANGCASNSLSDTAIVHPQKTSTLTVTICQGQSFLFNGVNYFNSNNTAKDTFTTSFGCDSVITLNLTMNPYIQATRTVTICQGQSYLFNGVAYTTNNTTAKDTVPSATTCDSVITLNLTVNPYIQATRTVTICQGQSYVFNGVAYTTNNTTAKDTVPSATTCDSVITLNLTVNPYIQATRTVTICQGQSYIFNGIAYTTNNTTAKDTVPSATTCDSVITLNLTVNPYIQATRTVTICQGQSYVFNGVAYTTNNTTAKDTVPSATTCDSVITLNLTVNPYIQATRTVTICQGQSYVFNGVAYTTNNITAKDTLPSVTTCDSVITLNLTVNPYIQATRTVTICQGQSYVFNGIAYTTNNTTAKDTVPSATTCDSVITLNLTVNPYIQAIRTVTICQGQSYVFSGVAYTTNNTTAKDTVPSVTTCDSVITLNLTVNPYIQATRTVTICQGQSYVFNGVAYTTNNTTAKDTVPSATTCDSFITLNLTVNPYIQATRAVTICQGQSYVFNGVAYTTNNTTAKDTVPSATTCDSVITLNLTVNPYIQATRTVTICQGQSYVFNGVAYNYSTQSPTDTILSSTGCDSIINLHLTVLPAYKTTQPATICYGQSYSFNGITYVNSNNTAQDTFKTVNGCDSIVTLNLTVSLPPTSVSIDTISCGAITINGVRYLQNTTLQDTLRTANGCDSVYRHITITIQPTYAYTQTWDTVACDSFLFEGKTYYSNTQFQDTLQTLMGCDSVYRTIKITIDHFQLELRSDLDLPYVGELMNLNTYSNQAYYQVLYWSPANLFPYQDKKSQYTKLHAPTTITVGAMSNSGCKDSASLAFQVLGLDYTVLFPNAFTPNGDGRNDVFRPLLNIKRGFQVKYFRILNRWGFEVFHQISQLLEGWDGRYQGVPQDNGVYFYYFEIEFADGHKVQMKGDVTLIR